MGFWKDVGGFFEKPLPILGAALGDVPILGPMLNAGAENQAVRDRNVEAANVMREQMAFSANEATKNRDFQERMSNSAHQRAMQDLKSAGLNPLLGLSDGASTPSGGQGDSAAYDPEALPAGRFLASSREAERWKHEKKMMRFDRMNAEQEIKLKDAQNRNYEETSQGLRYDNELGSMRNQFFKKHPFMFKLQAAAGGINSAGSILRLLK